MRYPVKDKFWLWRMNLFEVFAYWDSWRTSPNWHWHRWYNTQRVFPNISHVQLICWFAFRYNAKRRHWKRTKLKL